MVEAPEITGTFKVGETVTVDQGVWDSYTAPTFNYQWLLDGVGIVGATFNTYTIEAGDATKELSVKVFVGNPIGTTEFISTPVVVEAFNKGVFVMPLWGRTPKDQTKDQTNNSPKDQIKDQTNNSLKETTKVEVKKRGRKKKEDSKDTAE